MLQDSIYQKLCALKTYYPCYSPAFQVGNHLAYVIDVLRPTADLGQDLDPQSLMRGEEDALSILMHLAER
jgi:hypothetical protein